MKRLPMGHLYVVAFLFALVLPLAAVGREAKLVRYPHYHQGKIVFIYLGDIWTADENGQNINPTVRTLETIARCIGARLRFRLESNER